ncbi:MAG: hypothetical protein CL609_13795 [Anaerolineaceae bacterium]|nr:hypothetical protein [Anaerolineaceae bacterium]
MKNEPNIRDERFYAVENASYRLGFLILAFGTMILVVIRSILFHQTNWDFFILVVLSSGAATIYQIRNKIQPYSIKSLLIVMLSVLVASVLIGLLIVLIKTWLIG